MECHPGVRVKLSDEGIRARGNSYRSWTGTCRCSCAPYTIEWDQTGRTSEHPASHLMPIDEKRADEKCTGRFETGVAAYEASRGR